MFRELGLGGVSVANVMAAAGSPAAARAAIADGDLKAPHGDPIADEILDAARAHFANPERQGKAGSK